MMSAAKTDSPSHRSVYLITFSQCDSSELSAVQFAELIVEAWHTRSVSKRIQWVVSRGGWTAPRKASWEICVLFHAVSHSCVNCCDANRDSVRQRNMEASKDKTVRLQYFEKIARYIFIVVILIMTRLLQF